MRTVETGALVYVNFQRTDIEANKKKLYYTQISISDSSGNEK